jgi:iron complex transport system ATP-binding protein
MGTIEGVEIEIDPDAVVVTAASPLAVLSSAVVGGGLGSARAIVNLHVHEHCRWGDAELRLDAFAVRRGLPAPRVGLLTAAWTERARLAAESARGVSALVVATVGLGNVVTAGWSPPAPAGPGTINTIVVVDAAVEPAALVNLALTVTEVKASVLAEAGLTSSAGRAVTGTSTDAVVVAATGRGAAVRFGGPISDAGWVVAAAARTALSEGVRLWMDEPR